MTLQDTLQSIGIRLPTESIEAMIREAVRDALGPHDLLGRVAQAEIDRRRVGSFRRRLQRSHLGHAAAVADFDFQHPSRIDRALVEQAFSLRFLDEGGVVLFVGSVGLGKTHLARALVHASLAAGRRALFVDAQTALDDLVAARAAGRLRARLRHYLHPHLLCLDGVAYQRIDIERLDLLYDVVRKRYDAHRAIVITTALSFAQWPSVMPSTAATAAVVDRLVHRGTVITIEGESYRKTQAQQRAARRP
jgi:DNA replication protein DnaC